MAGPSLSHILDPPRPNTGRELYSTPPSYSSRDSLHPHSQQQRTQQTSTASGSASASVSASTSPGAPPAVSPNTRNLSTPPVALPPPTSASSTLQVRPAPAPAPGSITAPRAASPGSASNFDPVSAAASASHGGHHRSNSHSHAHDHGHGHTKLDPGAASAPAPPSTGVTTTSNTSNPQANHRGHNLYACRDCGRSYSRPEHLVRHVQTHTLGRRFVCEVCQKSFARKDLLRRHVANHDNDSPKKRRRTTTSPGAGRVSHACRSCAIARVKCDDTKPCKRCVSRKLTCVSTEAPSTAAMHLMHFSANAHSSPSNANEGSDAASKPVTTHSPATSRASHSPGSFTHQQPRSVPAPHSAHEPAPQQQQQHDLPYYRHGRAASSSVLPHPSLAKSTSHEPSQLPTPETYEEQGIRDLPPFTTELEVATSAMDPSRLPFSDFLRDVLYENSSDSSRSGPIQGLTILDFCDFNSLDLNEDDFGLLDHWNVEGNHGLAQGATKSAAGHARDGSSDMAQVRQDLVKMWTNSSWAPDSRPPEGGRNVALTTGGSDSTPESRDRIERVTSEKLEYSTRDRVLGLVLNNSRRNVSGRVASSFPSVEVMDILVQNFLTSLANQASEWIHFPTFRLNAQSPEWITLAAAAGTALSPVLTLRKFGFILQDAARATLPTQFDGAPSTLRDVTLVQALLLSQEIGLWSGNRRRMELAQSHLSIPVTFMRYRNKFQRSSYPATAVEPSDDGAELDDKWRRWIDRERWKRLVFHCFLRDAECSMTTLTNQTMSYAELTLPLPEPRELWQARTASEWKAEYLQRNMGQSRPAPSMGDLFHDVHALAGNSQLVDIQFSVSIYLHGYWALIMEYRKLSAVHRSRSYSGRMGGNQNLLLGSQHQELVKELQSFQLMTQEWPDMTSQEHLLLNLLIMNLHVSLDDLQLFAGKEGEEQARRIYPVLQQWASSSEARSAIWCAGQVFRFAKTFAPGQLIDFYAVAVHHAALAMWAYGVITKANHRPPPLPSQFQSDSVLLDGSETMSTQRFIGLGQGRPMVHGPMVRDTVAESSLEDPQGTATVAQEILRSNFRDVAESLPPMVDNLCTLIKQLGDAARAAGLGAA